MICSRRRLLIDLTAASTLLGVFVSQRARAGAWQPERPVEIIVGTDPGSGFDRTARLLQRIWQTAHLVDQPVTVFNKPGGYGALGWTYMNQHRRSGDYVAIISPLLLTDHLSGNMAMSYRDVTPLGLLLDEQIVTAVYAGLPIKTGQELIAKLRADPSSVSFGVSGVGGQNHLALALMAQAAGGIDVTKLKVVGFAGSGDVATAVIGGHVDATVSPASTVAPQVEAGRMRGIAVSGESRLSGPLASTPTWREQGVNSVFANWRGLIGPKDMTGDQIGFWQAVLAKTAQSKDWQDALAAERLTPHVLDGASLGTFLEAQSAELDGIMRKLGLAS